jgi:hypothetical protein
MWSASGKGYGGPELGWRPAEKTTTGIMKVTLIALDRFSCHGL